MGAAVGGDVGDSDVTIGLSDAILTVSLSTSPSSIVNPKPIVLIINANTDIPADLKRFLAGFLRIKLISAHKIKNGIHKKLMQNIIRNRLFIVSPLFFGFLLPISLMPQRHLIIEWIQSIIKE